MPTEERRLYCHFCRKTVWAEAESDEDPFRCNHCDSSLRDVAPPKRPKKAGTSADGCFLALVALPLFAFCICGGTASKIASRSGGSPRVIQAPPGEPAQWSPDELKARQDELQGERVRISGRVMVGAFLELGDPPRKYGSLFFRSPAGVDLGMAIVLAEETARLNLSLYRERFADVTVEGRVSNFEGGLMEEVRLKAPGGKWFVLLQGEVFRFELQP